MISSAVAILAMLAMATSASAQTVERSIRGTPNKDIRVGVYVNVKPDCSPGPLPSIRLVTPPAHGKVTVKRGTLKATNYKQCLALEVPGLVALYRSSPNFTGSDLVALEVKFPEGRTELQKITVSIGDGGSAI